MKAGLSVVITSRGSEPMLDRTIENLWATAGCPIEVIVVYDGEPSATTTLADQVFVHRKVRGVGASRHKGIQAAKYSIVFLTDAHMNFSKGFGEMVLQHHSDKKNAKDISCGISIGVNADLRFSETEKPRTACRFVEISKEPGNEVWIMSGKWADQKPGPIGCVYGACYAFRKSWYKKIGEPLNLLLGWWGDEEYLSISTWLAGGRCVMLDYKAGHLFREKPAYDCNREDVLRRTINRHRLMDMLPCPKKMKDHMNVRFQFNAVTMAPDYAPAKATDDKRAEVIDAGDLWASWEKNWKRLDKWIDKSAQPAAAARAMSSEAIAVSRNQVRKAFICTNCHTEDTFRVNTTRRVNGEKRQYGRCSECGHPGVMVKRGGAERLLWG